MGKKREGGREIENWFSLFMQKEDCVFFTCPFLLKKKAIQFPKPLDCPCFPPFSKQKSFLFNWLIPELLSCLLPHYEKDFLFIMHVYILRTNQYSKLQCYCFSLPLTNENGCLITFWINDGQKTRLFSRSVQSHCNQHKAQRLGLKCYCQKPRKEQKSQVFCE